MPSTVDGQSSQEPAAETWDSEDRRDGLQGEQMPRKILYEMVPR